LQDLAFVDIDLLGLKRVQSAKLEKLRRDMLLQQVLPQCGLYVWDLSCITGTR
jgi:hypothetical protein